MGEGIHTTGNEIFFRDSEIIVSKTDMQGKIIYGNKLFYDIAGYTESECSNKPHSMVRHPDMPRSVFQLLWDTIQSGQEIFAYVKNRAKNGDHYWVLAHVTPSYDDSGNLVGYHSNRRTPNRQALESSIVPLYKQLLKEEQRHGSRKEGCRAGVEFLNKVLQTKGVTYDEFIHTL
jgi:PAS domain S-box-containing protein